MRGDDASADERMYLVEVDGLSGIPVFSSSGKKLGVLEGVVIDKNCGAITYAVLCCSRLMGLRRSRRVLRQDALTLDAERGGFALADKAAREPKRNGLAADSVQHRLDPARSV
jgi:sporulation protein YlmC with PRC-barrel domain